MALPLNVKGIITGASTGIGRGLALHLARRYQAQLVLTARSEEALQKCAEEIKQLGGTAEILACDISEEGAAQTLVQRCHTAFGGIDLIVNNAGMAIPGKIEKLTESQWRRVFDVNFFSALQLTYASLALLKQSQRGKIANISSVAGKIAIPGSVCYSASKFALTAFSNGLAAELTDENIDVYTVCPGWVRTEFFAKNSVPDARNPNLIAEQNNLQGFVMKHFLSISTDECVKTIVEALSKNYSQELILTVPGKLAERFNGLAPQLVAQISRHLKTD